MDYHELYQGLWEKHQRRTVALLAGYCRLLIESPVGKLFSHHPLGQWLAELPSYQRVVAAFSIQTANTLTDTSIPDTEPLISFAKQVGRGVVQEISKRVLQSPSNTSTKSFKGQPLKNLAELTGNLSADHLQELARFLETLTVEQQEQFRHEVSKMIADNLIGFLQITPEQRVTLLQFLHPQSTTKKFFEEIRTRANCFNDVLKDANTSLSRTRQGLKEKRRKR